jgi:phosphate starvation-inducible protein PhoH
MGGNIVENSAVKVVSFSRRNYPSVLGNNCALFATGRADLGHSWKAKAAVDARLHDDIDRIVAWLRRNPGFEFGEKPLDSITNLLLKGMKR